MIKNVIIAFSQRPIMFKPIYNIITSNKRDRAVKINSNLNNTGKVTLFK